MRAWKRDGCPEVGYWMWTGEVDLAREVDIDCKSDWVPHGLNLHNRRLGEYNTFQITAKGIKNLCIDNCTKTWQLPPKVEIHHRHENNRNNLCRAFRTLKTVVKCKFCTSPIDPFATMSQAQSCGQMQKLELSERPFRHFVRVGRSKLW